MKKCIVWLLLITFALPCGCACAEYVTIGELRETVPDRWTQAYETKWRTIEIDMEPTIPDVQNVPIQQVMIDYWTPDVSALGDGAVVAVRDGLFQVNLNEIVEAISQRNRGKRYFPPYDQSKAYGEVSELTLGDLMDILRELWAKLGQDPNGFDYDNPLQLSADISYGEKQGEALYPDIFFINIRQAINNITLLGHVSMGIHNPKPQNDFNGYFGNFNFAVSSPKLLYLVGMKMIGTDVIAEDVPLCDFETVKSALEKEIEAGHIRKIFDISFGYVLKNTPGTTIPYDSPVFYATPAWQVNCLYVNKGKTNLRDYSGLDAGSDRNTHESKILIIDAQTGEIKDPSDNSKGCVDYHGYTSWEDVINK